MLYQLLILLLLPPTYSQKTLDPCQDSCTAPLLCRSLSQTACNNTFCLCFPLTNNTFTPQFCSTESDCPSGEVCRIIITPTAPRQICVSEKVAERPMGGYTLDRCTGDGECEAGRECVNWAKQKCMGEEMCACAPVTQNGVELLECGECEKGERCVKSGESSWCISKQVVGERDEEQSELEEQTDVEEQQGREQAGCIDARLLRDVSVVYGRHIWKRALCDERGNCATGGHMVEWKGRVMRMSKYCERVGCEIKWMWVNSQKGWHRVTGNGIQFLSVATRWDRWWEEVLLRGVVWGLRI